MTIPLDTRSSQSGRIHTMRSSIPCRYAFMIAVMTVTTTSACESEKNQETLASAGSSQAGSAGSVGLAGEGGGGDSAAGGSAGGSGGLGGSTAGGSGGLGGSAAGGSGGLGGSAAGGSGGLGGSAAGGSGGGSVWSPQPGSSWQWQLTGTIDQSFNVAMYDIDLFDTDRSTIDDLHQAGRIVICYFSAGSWEDWRDDASSFPSSALGNELHGWPDERWLDIRDPTVRLLMQARMDLAAEKSCDGVEPDNVDGYDNKSGFDFGAIDQLEYNRFLANEAHARGLSIGLKNDLAQVNQLVDEFDWALNEECYQWDECNDLLPFIQAGKAVFHVEYGNASLASEVCPVTSPLGFSTLIKRLDLDAWRVACD